jgi:hypothetical protein
MDAHISYLHRRFALVQAAHATHLQWLTYIVTYLIASFFAWRNIGYLPGAVMSAVVLFQLGLSLVYNYIESPLYSYGETPQEETRALDLLTHYRAQHYALQRLGNCVLWGLTIWTLVVMFITGPSL